MSGIGLGGEDVFGEQEKLLPIPKEKVHDVYLLEEAIKKKVAACLHFVFHV